MPDPTRDFPYLLTLYMAQAGVKRKSDIAEMLNVSSSVLSAMLRGARTLTAPDLWKLQKGLDLTEQELGELTAAAGAARA